MNARERFLEVCDFNPNVRPLKWEFGYWGETIKKLVCPRAPATAVSAAADGNHHAGLLLVHTRVDMPAAMACCPTALP